MSLSPARGKLSAIQQVEYQRRLSDGGRKMVGSNSDRLAISAHHHMLEDTAVAPELNYGVGGVNMHT